MSHHKHHSKTSETRERLASALGNRAGIATILKEFTYSDSVDLLWYDDIEKCFVNKSTQAKIPIKFLESGSPSMIGEAYKNKVPYRSTHIHYDTHYNVALDNPHKLDISAQLIFPVMSQEDIVGIIRFSKNRYTFHETILHKLQQLESSLVDIFSTLMDDRVARLNDTFFSVDAELVYSRIDTIKREIKHLLEDAHNPEIKKIITKAEESVDHICEYIRFDTNAVVPMKKRSIPSKLHILIADDVPMNVKILHAMLKIESDAEISFAYDGIETLEKIEMAKQEENHVDILYLDHYMPGKLGLEVAQAIRKEEKLNLQHKITIVSITNDPSAIEREKNLYDYHISKPFSKSSISSAMESIMSENL